MRKSGFTVDQLLQAYKTRLRLVLEYSATVYHSMLCKEQMAHLEDQQYRALKRSTDMFTQTGS